MRCRHCIVLALLLWPRLAWSGDSELLPELHEEVVKVPMVVDGFWGKRELQLTATVFRPDAIRRFARTTRVPVLWHYAENDRFFAPRYTRSWFAAFQQAGGRGKLVLQPPFARDGHSLFPSPKGIPIWTKEFDLFVGEFGINGSSPNPTD